MSEVLGDNLLSQLLSKLFVTKETLYSFLVKPDIWKEGRVSGNDSNVTRISLKFWFKKILKIIFS